MPGIAIQTAIGLFLILMTISCGKPWAAFTYSAEKHVAPATIRFQNNSIKAESYHWDFGDGKTSEEAAPVHVYSTSGNYLVRLTAVSGRKSTMHEQRIMITAPIECLVKIETDLGVIMVQLSNATPHHRDNFIKLAEEGYLDGTLFHRVIEGFMIQGGDPDSRNAVANQPLGSGGPEYTIPAEFVDSLIHIKGALAAARLGDQINPEKRSSGSQFYVVQGKPLTMEELDMIAARKGIRYTQHQREIYTTLGGTPLLDRDYTVFGHVISGLDVIDKIAAVATDSRDRPLKDVRMKVSVIR